ncbi:MAG: tetratricopeptide repeat protein [Bacteroidia bacterium]
MRSLIFSSVLLFLLNVDVNGQSLDDAKKLTLNEQYESASSMFLRLVAKFPMKGDYWYYFGENLLKAENTDSAETLFSSGIQNEPSNPLNFVGLGKVYKTNGRMEEADAAFKKALDLGNAKNAEVFIRISDANISITPKNLSKAFEYLQLAEKLQPKNPEVYILQGDAFLENNNGTEAVKFYEKAKKLEPNSPTATLRLGQLWVRARNYQGKDGEKGALEYYNEAIDASPEFAPAYRELGDLFALAQRYDDAKANYEKYLQLSKGNIVAKRRYAAFKYKTNDFRGALEELDKIAVEDAGYNINNRLAAYCYYEIKEYTKGLEAMERFIALQPENKLLPKDFEYYGKLLSENGKDSLAIIKLRQAIELDNANTDLYANIGAIYYKQKNYAMAAEMYEAKIRESKPAPNDYFRLGQAYFQLKRYGEADSVFIKVTEAQPKMVTGYSWRAKANSNLDPDSKLGLAKPFYEKVIELCEADEATKTKYKKDLLDAYKYQGAYYFLVNNDKATSISWWEKVLTLAPEDEQAKKVLADLRK